jgi:ribosomal protein S18 acetylase RimI-like enzyme
MKLSEILNEAPEEMTVQVTPAPGNRTLFTGIAKHAGSMMSRIRSEVVCEITTEQKPDSMFIGYVDSKVLKAGWGTKLLQYVVKYYTKQGITDFSAYIPKDNQASMALFNKCGFTITKTQQHGTFWELHL